MARPVIGVTAQVEQVAFGAWNERSAFVPVSYTEAVQRAGGVAVLLPPDPSADEDPSPWLDLLDGLVLTGGADVDPAAYGAEPHPMTRNTVPARDAFELALTRSALERELPLLGVCRGMQVLNVALGGTLIQHLPDAVGHDGHRRSLGTFQGNDHDVRLVPGSLAARAAGEDCHPTKSHHHQAVDCLGSGLVVTGHAVEDELPEAVELPGRWVLGVQWHPEADEASRVIGSLVRAAQAGGTSIRSRSAKGIPGAAVEAS
jgi:putative glutamine amidotransferase